MNRAPRAMGPAMHMRGRKVVDGRDLVPDLTLHLGAGFRIPAMDNAVRPLTVSKLAEAADVELSTIRYYERRGLVKPVTRRASGYREYDCDAVRRVRFIRHAQELGFSLEEIAELMALRMEAKGSCADVRRRAQRKVDDIGAKIISLNRMRSALERLIENCPSDAPSSECPILEAIDEAHERAKR